ncbi:hypothetical protein PF011_g13126 [Phytophthora fragariae]|uniref:Uncharacterized protein n=2 Tax=Phytophthora TaxID=4783 RepID=A0A6A3K5W1_9STRA|nr:hypothetical protein PF011_g13126 [Phytophthora fragariae]
MWCFNYSKGLKEIGHNVDRGGVVLPLHQGKSFKATGHNVSRGGVVLQLLYSKLLLRHKRDEIDKAYMYMYTHSR